MMSVSDDNNNNSNRAAARENEKEEVEEEDVDSEEEETVGLLSPTTASDPPPRKARQYSWVGWFIVVILLVVVCFGLSQKPALLKIGKKHSEKQQQRPQPLSLWEAKLKKCRIIFYVHIPKTAGTAVNARLEADLGSLFRHLSKREGQDYVSNPSKAFASYKRVVAQRSVNYSQFVMSAEHGIEGFRGTSKNWTADFGETCFFSTVRNPYDWVLSAANHMKVPLSSRRGYLKKSNIQTRMTGYQKYVELHSEVASLPETVGRSLPYFPMCLFTVDTVDQAFESLYKVLGVKGNGTLPRVNARHHSHNRTARLENLIATRYLDDVELYENVMEHDGILCW